jgi:hypothetical protein
MFDPEASSTPDFTISEPSGDCTFMVECATDISHTVHVYDAAGNDITRDEDGHPGSVNMRPDGIGTHYCSVSICGVKSGDTVEFVVCKQADPSDCMRKSITLDHDCPACEEAAAEAMPATAMSVPAEAPAAKPKAKAKAKAKPKAKAKAAAKPKAKPKKKPAAKAKKVKPTAKAKPKVKKKPVAKAKKAKPVKKKPAKKKPVAKKKRR